MRILLAKKDILELCVSLVIYTANNGLKNIVISNYLLALLAVIKYKIF